MKSGILCKKLQVQRILLLHSHFMYFLDPICIYLICLVGAIDVHGSLFYQPWGRELCWLSKDIRIVVLILPFQVFSSLFLQVKPLYLSCLHVCSIRDFLECITHMYVIYHRSFHMELSPSSWICRFCTAIMQGTILHHSSLFIGLLPAYNRINSASYFYVLLLVLDFYLVKISDIWCLFPVTILRNFLLFLWVLLYGALWYL